VKKRVKRLGVMGGGRLGFRLPNVAVAVGGDEQRKSGVGSCNLLRGAHGEDIFCDQPGVYTKDSWSEGQNGPQLEMIVVYNMGWDGDIKQGEVGFWR
jgi:hypothetical protein